MENNHNEVINDLIESQVEDIKSHISNIDKYLNEGKTAKAFLSLQLIAHTEEMKKFGTRILNRVVYEITGEDYCNIKADNWHILYHTEDFTLKFPIIKGSKDIIIVDKKFRDIRENKEEFDDEGNHLTNLVTLDKLETYLEDRTDDNLKEFIKERRSVSKISFIDFARNKRSFESLACEGTLKTYRNIVDLGNKAYEEYDNALKKQRELMSRARENLSDFIEMGYKIKLIR